MTRTHSLAIIIATWIGIVPFAASAAPITTESAMPAGSTFVNFNEVSLPEDAIVTNQYGPPLSPILFVDGGSQTARWRYSTVAAAGAPGISGPHLYPVFGSGCEVGPTQTKRVMFTTLVDAAGFNVITSEFDDVTLTILRAGVPVETFTFQTALNNVYFIGFVNAVGFDELRMDVPNNDNSCWAADHFGTHPSAWNDLDGDGDPNAMDNCQFVPNPTQADTDGDGLGDACDPQNGLDLDGDGDLNVDDNCPFEPNAGQEDLDADGIGDACDAVNNNDVDGDTIVNLDDNCPFVANTNQADADSDGLGDACDGASGTDADGDTVDNMTDNCPFEANTNQADADSDGLGDVCDPSNGNDLDGDTVANAIDNCPFAGNTGQEDADADGVGDACDGSTETGEVNGCGCRTTAPSSALVILLALGLLARRRRTDQRKPPKPVAAPRL